ncbi:MAG: GNAT family N-acetyltransferase [Planctomycetaceae bacterium]|nr:GNAT family N-acetyltransferase [Planctomycetaceae bacterium]
MSGSAFEIHVVTAAAASLLDQLDDDVFDQDVQPDLLREFLASPSHVLVVAVWSTQVVGMATGVVHVHPDKPRSLFINEVGVSRRFHRRGIGRGLIAAILDWGRTRGCVEAWVAAEAGDIAAQSFYEATGGIAEDEHAVVYVYPLAAGPPAGSDA